MNKVKAFLFVLATAVMVACLVYARESANTVSLAYLSVTGIYLGLDIAEMITSTARMKKGDFKKIAIHKYVISASCFAVCIITCMIVYTPELSSTMTTYISALLFIIGCVIGGLEGNKIATKNDGEGKSE